MEGDDMRLVSEFNKKIFQIFEDFLTRVTKFEELVGLGSRFLTGFQQGLEFLRRSPLNKSSELVNNIIKANETTRMKSYVEAGCINSHDGIQNVSKLHTCQVGLQDHLNTARHILHELEGLVKDVSFAMQSANDILLPVLSKHFGVEYDQRASMNEKVDELEPTQDEISCSQHTKPELTEYAVLMGVIFSMLKQDCMMQEKIISSLNLKSSSGELQTYCTMWSLRPFINDEIMHEAWRLIPR